MQTIKVKKDKLIEILNKNLAVHLKEYNSAVEVFRAEAIKQMKKNLKQAQKDGKVVLTVSLFVPTSYAKEYETAIGMLELTEDTVIELSLAEYKQYVEDEWQWKHSFHTTTAVYNNFTAK